MARTITVQRTLAAAAVDATAGSPGFIVTLDCGHQVKASGLLQLGQEFSCDQCAALAAAAPGLPA